MRAHAKSRKTRITRREYELLGGMANSKLFRKALKNGVWTYWQVLD